MGAVARCTLLVLTGLTAVAAQEPDAVRNERLLRQLEPGGQVVCYRMTHEVWEGHLTGVSSWTLTPGVQPGFTPDCMVP